MRAVVPPRSPLITLNSALAAIAALLVLGCVATSHAAPAADDAHEQYQADFEATCPSPPEPPELPRGELAGRDDMVDAMREVKAFDRAAAAFAQCARARLAVLQAGPGLTDEDRTLLTGIAANLADGAIAESERLAAAFNRELQQFKARPQDKVGRRYVPASHRTTRPGAFRGCYTERMWRQGKQGRVFVDLRIGVDGRATATQHDRGATPDMIAGAECIARRLQMNPATRDGVPEESVRRMPINFLLDGNEGLVSPTLRSSGEEFVSATAACYPDELGIDGPQGQLLARIYLTRSGRVRRVEIITATGNAALDEAGQCIARQMRFTPIRVNGMPREGDLAWEIPVRPPAAWIANPPAAQSP